MLSSWMMTWQCTGTMVGSGSYSLLGPLAQEVGTANVWLTFAIAGFIILFTGLSMAELISRFPKAGSIPAFLLAAFGIYSLAICFGVLAIAEGMVALGATGRSFGNSFHEVMPAVSSNVATIGVSLTFLFGNWFGLEGPAILGTVCTWIELSGLVVATLVGLPSWGTAPLLEPTSLTALCKAVLLATFAFGGLQGALDYAEEVENPKQTMPKAILSSALVTCGLYIAVAISMSSIFPTELATRTMAIPDAIALALHVPPLGFRLISLCAIWNTSQGIFITVSRLVCGMAQQGFLPKILGERHHPSGAPRNAILATWCAMVLLVSCFDVFWLVEFTSSLLLCSFLACNVSLCKLKSILPSSSSQEGGPVSNPQCATWCVPRFVPWLGSVSIVAVMLCAVWFDPSVRFPLAFVIAVASGCCLMETAPSGTKING